MLPDIYINKKFQYINKKCSEMTDEEKDACVNLFSQNYGVWSDKNPDESKRGKKISISRNRLQTLILGLNDSYVAIVKLGNEFVGHAFYLLRNISESTLPIAFILQLVVADKYRGQRIGRSLMFSIWGVSDCYAWGLFTSNPFTIKSLEDCTFRRISIQKIDQNIDILKKYLSDVLPETKWLDSYNKGVVNTQFFVDHSKIQEKKQKAYPNWGFPFEKQNLDEGHEWLAVIFKEQRISHLNDKNIKQLLDVSNSILQFAYSQMDMINQPWARHQTAEVDYLIFNKYIKKNKKILDVGCGQGRHTIELTLRGYDTFGIDFSEENIKKAKELAQNKGIKKCIFEHGDIRTYTEDNKYDTVLCLYDVIGSFVEEKENNAIILNCFNCLKYGGILILSVMNMDLTESLCSRDRFIDDMYDRRTFKRFFKIHTSKIMQKTGDIFNPEYIFIDKKKNIVYRKEQFTNLKILPTELIIADRRYKRNEIEEKVKNVGFRILDSRYVQAGHWENNLNSQNQNAKEILIIARKENYYRLKIQEKIIELINFIKPYGDLIKALKHDLLG